MLHSPLHGPGVTIFDVLKATDYVTPALEIIDARIEQFDRDTRAPRKVFDTIADFAANAGIVVGGRPVKPDAVDLRWVGAPLQGRPQIGLWVGLADAASAAARSSRVEAGPLAGTDSLPDR